MAKCGKICYICTENPSNGENYPLKQKNCRMENIDNTDKAILRALQENAKLTTKE